MAKLQNKIDIYDRVAWGIIGAIALLVIISSYAIWIAASNDSTLGTPFKAVIGQAVWYILSIALATVIMQFDADQLFKTAPYAYALGIILLILVLIFYDRSSFVNNGAKSWFKLGSLIFQPSEAMKLVFILMLVRIVKDHNEYYGYTWRNDWLFLGKIFAWLAPTAVLLKLQNDLGTMLVFFAIVGGVILVSGITWKITVPISIVIAALGTTTILLVTTSWGQAFLGHFFKAYQFERINSWLDPSGDTSSGAYQLWQSMKAIGPGQIWGSGFGKSSVYVPVRSSDTVFFALGESFGSVGGAVLIMIYLYLIIQMVTISFDTRNAFYSYISTGIIMMILFHVFENTGMSIDLPPLTGIPLPFVSQGGSALIGNMIGIGLILSMKFHNKDYIFSTAGDF